MSGFISAGPWLQAQERPSAAAGFSSPAPWVWAASAQAQHGTPLAGYSTVWPFASVVQANQAGFASPLPLLPRGGEPVGIVTGKGSLTFSTFRVSGYAIPESVITGVGAVSFRAFFVSGSALPTQFPTLIDRVAARPTVPNLKPIPAIPPVPAEVGQQTYEFLTSLREATQVRFGQTQNSLDRSVTVRELQNAGVLEAAPGAGLKMADKLEEAIDPTPEGEVVQGVLRDIEGVEFSVNVTGVVITWAAVLGIDYNEIAYTQIWRSGPFDLINGDYPAMAIAVDGSGGATVAWLDPANALDENGQPLPTPTVALAGVANGFIYGEPLELGRSYQYFLRFVGTDGTPSAWHSINGSRVDAVVDYIALLEAFKDQIGLIHLDSALKTSLSRIDQNTGELVTLKDLLDDEIAARSAAILNEAAARDAAIAAEASVRATRIQDIFDYVAAKYAATNTIVESRGLIQDAEISRIEIAYQDADAALAAQVQTLVATTGGNWFVQPGEPTIDSAWVGTYHWVDTDGQNKHWVSTDDSRDPVNGADGTNNWGGWLDVTDTRVTANAAAIVVERNTRIDAFNALSQDITNLSGQITNPSTGLAAVSNAVDALDAFVRDQGVAGFLATASRFTNLEAKVNQNQTNIAGGVTAQQTLEAYLADTTSDGYIQRTLFGTQLGSELASSISGSYATQAALDALDTYIRDQGPSGFLAEASQFTQLSQDVTTALSNATANTQAVNDLSLYLNDQGPGGFLQSATRFTNLEADYANLTTQTVANANAINTLDIYVKDSGPTGLLAQSQYITNLKSSIDTNTSEINRVSSALTTEQQARVNDVRELRVALGDPNDPRSSAIFQEAASLVATVEGRMAGRYYTAIDINGRITGFEFYDNNGNLRDAGSAFKVYTDTFIIENSNGQQPLRMTNNVFSLDLSVIQLNGVIPSANIGHIDVSSITGITSNFIASKIGDATITTAKLAEQIQSVNFNIWTTGWAINSRTGNAVFHDIYARGNIEASSIKAGAAIVDTLNLGNEVVIVPRYAEYAPGNLRMTSGTHYYIPQPIIINYDPTNSLRRPKAVQLNAYVTVSALGTAGATTLYAWILANNSPIAYNAVTLREHATGQITLSFLHENRFLSGNVTYQLRCSVDGTNRGLYKMSLTAMAAKR